MSELRETPSIVRKDPSPVTCSIEYLLELARMWKVDGGTIEAVLAAARRAKEGGAAADALDLRILALLVAHEMRLSAQRPS